MKRILIFPGAFNPPHLGHVAILQVALPRGNFDEVWIVPSGKRDDKVISLSYDHRRNLGNLFVDYLTDKLDVPVKLVTAELDDKEVRYTQEILKDLKSQPGIDVTQLIGSDGLQSLISDLKSSGNFEKEKFIVLQRPGSELPADFIHDENIIILNSSEEGISSSKIRKMVSEGDLGYIKLTPENIASYIEKNNLYRTS